MSDEAVKNILLNTSWRDAAPITTSDVGVHNYDGLAADAVGVAYVDFLGGGTNIPIVVSDFGVVPHKVTRVYATGTTATGIIGFNARS